jgi:hypothetical protein
MWYSDGAIVYQPMKFILIWAAGEINITKFTGTIVLIIASKSEM